MSETLVAILCIVHIRFQLRGYISVMYFLLQKSGQFQLLGAALLLLLRALKFSYVMRMHGVEVECFCNEDQQRVVTFYQGLGTGGWTYRKSPSLSSSSILTELCCLKSRQNIFTLAGGTHDIKRAVCRESTFPSISSSHNMRVDW